MPAKIARVAKPAAKAAADARDQRGRFAPGCKPGPGRPTAEREREYLGVLQSRVTPKKWAKIVDRALNDAMKGDGVARAWIAKYLVSDANVERLAAGNGVHNGRLLLALADLAALAAGQTPESLLAAAQTMPTEARIGLRLLVLQIEGDGARARAERNPMQMTDEEIEAEIAQVEGKLRLGRPALARAGA